MRRRVLISILLVIAATVLTLGVPLSIVSWRVVDDLMRSDLSSRLDSIAASIANQSASSEIDLGQLEAAVPAGGRLEIRRAGRIDQSIGPPLSDEVFSEQLAIAGGSLRLTVPESYLRSEQWTALVLVAMAVLLSVVVGTGVAVLTAGRLVTPLTDVARRAARLGSGDFRTFRRRYGIPELDRVADVLDLSAQDIAALIARERDLAGDISHQLRTRLTGLRPGKVVAELTFGFWRYLSAKRHEKTLWVPHLHRAFPPGTDRQQIDRMLERTHQLRNRVSHHEPLLQRDPVTQVLDVSVTRLQDQHAVLHQLARLLSPELADYLHASSTVLRTISGRP